MVFYRAEMELEVREKIKILRAKIGDLQSRLPAHSIPAAMIIELDELEEELNYWISQLKSENVEQLNSSDKS